MRFCTIHLKMSDTIPVWRMAGRALALLIGAAAVASSSAAERKIDFNREIRPLLSENCFSCHGPDEQKRKAKLRLDIRDEALKPAKSGERAIVPNDTAKSQ